MSRNAMLSIAVSLALASGTAWAQQQDAARAQEYAGAAFDAKTVAEPGVVDEAEAKSISTKGVSSTKPGRTVDAAAEPASRSISEKGVRASGAQHRVETAAEPADKSISEQGVRAAKPANSVETAVEPASKSISEKGLSADKPRRKK